MVINTTEKFDSHVQQQLSAKTCSTLTVTSSCNNHASWVKTEGLGLRVLPVPLPTTMLHLQERSKTYKSVDKSTKKARKRQEGNLIYKLGI